MVGVNPAIAGTAPEMPDVVLPVLDEREALPWVLERMPRGYAPIVVDNGSTDGSGELAAELGARVVREPQPGFGAACFAGLTRRGAPRSSASWTATRRSTRASSRASPTRSRPAPPTSCSAPGAPRPGRVWPPHARLANAVLALRAAPPDGRARDRPRPDARRAPRGAARARDPRPPLRLAAGDGPARVGRGLAARGGPGRATSPARGARRSRGRSAAPCARCATWPPSSGEPRAPRRAYTPSPPPSWSSPRRRSPAASRRGSARPARPSRPRRWPRAAIEDTLAAALRRGPRGPARRRARRRARPVAPARLRDRPAARRRARAAARGGVRRRRRPGLPRRHGHAAGHARAAGGRARRGRRRRRGVRRGARRRLLGHRPARRRTRACSTACR